MALIFINVCNKCIYISKNNILIKSNKMSTLRLDNFLTVKGISEFSHYVELSSNKIVATNSHILIKSTIEDVFGCELANLRNRLEQGNIYIHKNEWKKISNKEIMDCIVISESADKLFLQFEDYKGSSILVAAVKNIHFKFPDPDKVIPSEDSSVSMSEFGMDLEQLNKIHSSLTRRIGIKAFKIKLNGEKKAMLISHKSLPNTTILSMPVLIDNL